MGRFLDALEEAGLKENTFVVLCTTRLQSQTLFNGTPGIDLLDAANWSNGLPGPGNDGTIGISGSFVTGNVLKDWGDVTIVGRDDTTAIEELITAGYFFAIDGVFDDDPNSYSLVYDGGDTVFGLSSGTGGAPIRITTTRFDTSTRTFSVTWESVGGATYTVWESPDLSSGGWTEVDNDVAGQETTTTYPIPGLPGSQMVRYYRVSRNP